MKLLRLSSLVAVCCFALVAQISAQQTVFLDFDSGTDGSINYTTAMRDDVQSQMEAIYSGFNVSFTQSNPGGTFATVTFNSGSAGGVAQHIDFRNLDKADSAVVNVDGLGFGSTPDIVRATSFIGSHELGHLLGLRHRDSFGPIGGGVISGVSGSFLPSYPGPTTADEFDNHVMATPALGQPLSAITSPAFFSERSAIKLTFNESGSVVSEQAGAHGSIGTAQAVTLDNMTVLNTILTGDNAGIGDFSVDAVAVTGALGAGGELDFYSFSGNAGDLMNFEVMSNALSHRIGNVIDPQISIFHSNGTAVDYYGTAAFNDDEIETLDSVIIDLILPSDDTYFVQINAFGAGDTGSYELFMTRFNGAAVIPEPSSAMILVLVSGLVLARRRRR